jgi:hypothetical protein
MSMQKLNARHSAVVLALLCAPGAALATPFAVFDARAMAMGGTGVSAGLTSSAPYFNPALLSAARRKSATALEITAGVRAHDPQDLVDDADRVESAFNGVEDALDAFNAAPQGANPQTQAAAGQLATALGPFRDVFNTVSNKNLEVNAFASPLTITVPGKDLGWAIFGAARADAGARFVGASSDDALLASYQAAAQQYANTGSATDLAALCAQFGDTSGTTCDLEEPDFASRIEVRGAVVREIGISFAREFHGRSMNWAFGITPKYQKVSTFDYSVNPQDEEDIDADTGRKDYSDFNFDLGVAKELGSGFRAGLVGRNMISRSYTTVLDNKIELKPQYRLGLSHHSSWSTLALDVDLNKSTPIAFEQEGQFVGLGFEFDVWNFVQLRIGYRGDLKGNYDGVPSAGFGLSLAWLHLDAAVARRGNDEVMGAVQLGLRF